MTREQAAQWVRETQMQNELDEKNQKRYTKNVVIVGTLSLVGTALFIAGVVWVIKRATK